MRDKIIVKKQFPLKQQRSWMSQPTGGSTLSQSHL